MKRCDVAVVAGDHSNSEGSVREIKQLSGIPLFTLDTLPDLNEEKETPGGHA
jgi:hypothetical protein